MVERREARASVVRLWRARFFTLFWASTVCPTRRDPHLPPPVAGIRRTRSRTVRRPEGSTIFGSTAEVLVRRSLLVLALVALATAAIVGASIADGSGHAAGTSAPDNAKLVI